MSVRLGYRYRASEWHRRMPRHGRRTTHGTATTLLRKGWADPRGRRLQSIRPTTQDSINRHVHASPQHDFLHIGNLPVCSCTYEFLLTLPLQTARNTAPPVFSILASYSSITAYMYHASYTYTYRYTKERNGGGGEGGGLNDHPTSLGTCHTPESGQQSTKGPRWLTR